MSLNIKFSYLAENSKFSRSNSYFSILTPTFLRDGFLNSCFQNPSENSVIHLVCSIIPSCKFDPRRVWQHSFIEIDHERFSLAILFFLLIQEGQFTVSFRQKNMCKYWLTT